MTKDEILKLVLEALRDAPVKYRIDFDPYWWWYDQKCVPTIEKLEKELSTVDRALAKE